MKPDGIEAKLMALGEKPLTPAVLNREQADLIRMTEVTAAVAAISFHQCPVKVKMGEKDPAQWKVWMTDVHGQSVALANALKAKDPDKVKTAALKLEGTCQACHKVYR